jgi:DNA repair protein RecN (Recombination protein N)
MLRYLRVRNFALIDHLDINFESGFSLLSGETGAGKSLIVDALELLAGSKASMETIRSGESRASIEAIFETDLTDDLERLGLDAEGAEVIIKREISSDGRNRVFINNQPTTVSALKEIAPALLDIHGQHEQQSLLDPSRQLALIDAFAGASDLAAKVRALDGEIQAAESQLAALVAERALKVERHDLLAFQRDEIQKANPKPGEADQARERLGVVANASKLLDTATRGYEALYESETSVTSTLAQTQRALRDAAQHDKRLEPLAAQAESARILVQDIAEGLRDYSGRVEADPRELERLQSRLAELERLHRKYGPDLPAHLEKVTGEMDSIGLTETQIERFSKKIGELRGQYSEAAAALSRTRRSASKKLEALVVSELKSLAMPNVRFQVVWSDLNPPRASGIDRAELRISPNPGEDPRPLERIASGGELSRVMLGLRTILAVDAPNKTLVFDEVDAGIGGKAAETVGRKLQQLSESYQVFCVTHLAQIAAFADHQFHIEKLVVDGRTVTRLSLLEGDARIDELARMMSGSRVTDAARQHIREMLRER